MDDTQAPARDAADDYMDTQADKDPSDPSLSHRMALGAAWVTAIRAASRFLGLISTVILARLLLPSDFGLVALATLIAASLELLSAFNFNLWLIQHPDPKRQHYDTVWTLNVARGIITASVLVLLAHPLADFFEQPAIAMVLVALAFGQIVEGLQNVGIVDFQKHLDFHKEFQMFVTTRFGAFVVTIAAALAYQSYWALVAGIVIGKLIQLVLSYALHEHRPQFTLARWRDALDFSKWVIVNSLSSFTYGRLDAFFIGKWLSTEALGFYALAREIADLAASEIVAPIRRVMLPGYSKINDDRERMKIGFLDGFALIVLIGAPFAVGIGLVADPLVRIMLGDKWLACIPLVQLLSIYAVTAIVGANQVPLLLAMGDPRTLAGLNVAALIILIPAIAYGINAHGLVGLALAVSGVNAVVVAVGLHIVLDRIAASWASLIRRILPCVLALLAMAYAVRIVAAQLRDHNTNALIELVVCSLTGAVLYSSTLIALWIVRGRPPGAERRILDEVHNWRTRKAPLAS